MSEIEFPGDIAQSTENALNAVVASIALEEAALSEILEAEGKKIKKVVKMDTATVDDLLNVNRSVVVTINCVILKEIVLLLKLFNTVQALEART
jgi:hypothetical protein